MGGTKPAIVRAPHDRAEQHAAIGLAGPPAADREVPDGHRRGHELRAEAHPTRHRTGHGAGRPAGVVCWSLRLRGLRLAWRVVAGPGVRRVRGRPGAYRRDGWKRGRRTRRRYSIAGPRLRYGDRQADPHLSDARRPHHRPRPCPYVTGHMDLRRQLHRMARPARRRSRRPRRLAVRSARAGAATCHSCHPRTSKWGNSTSSATSRSPTPAGLLAAGVSVELHVRPGCPHGFERISADADVAQRSHADRVRALAGY